ncbi:hypothetical protein Tco_0930158 [Tanacetum coccineum]
MSPANKAHFESEKEAIHLILTGIGDEISSIVDACKTTHEMTVNELRVKGMAKNAQPISIVAMLKNYARSLLSKLQNIINHAPNIHKASTSTRLCSDRQQRQEIAKQSHLHLMSASKEDIDPDQLRKDKDMQKNCSHCKGICRWSSSATSLGYSALTAMGIWSLLLRTGRKPKRVRGLHVSQEKILLCKQDGKVLKCQLQRESNWLATRMRKLDEQSVGSTLQFPWPKIKGS